MNTSLFNIWCFERGMYWRAGKYGYTPNRSEAGVYPLSEAQEICELANRYSVDPEEAMIPVKE